MSTITKVSTELANMKKVGEGATRFLRDAILAQTGRDPGEVTYDPNKKTVKVHGYDRPPEVDAGVLKFANSNYEIGLNSDGEVVCDTYVDGGSLGRWIHGKGKAGSAANLKLVETYQSLAELGDSLGVQFDTDIIGDELVGFLPAEVMS